MSFDLLFEKSFAANVRRIAGNGLEQAQLTLSQNGAEARSEPKAIHTARKELKKLRALLHLTRLGIREEIFARENLRYRTVGQALSAVRDAAVLVQAFDELRPKLQGLLSPETIASIHKQLLAGVEANEVSIDLPAVATELAEARERVKVWPWLRGEDTWRVSECGLRKVYRKGRRALSKATMDHSAAEDFHEWRKQVKLLAAQLRWLIPLHPSDLSPIKRFSRTLCGSTR